MIILGKEFKDAVLWIVQHIKKLKRTAGMRVKILINIKGA